MITFEIHKNAPELNKVFKNGFNITRLFTKSRLSKLTNDYNYNLILIRKALKNNNLRAYKLEVTRPDGTKEIRFCNVPTITDALQQLKKAKNYYCIPNTKIKFTRILIFK